MTTLKIPTVHLNGTDKQSLLAGYAEAIAALHEAGRALAATYPNGRDYYVQDANPLGVRGTGKNAINVAMEQHEARQAKLKEIISELELIAECIVDQ